MKFHKKVTYLAILLTLIAGVEISQAKSKGKPRSDLNTTYTIIHAIPSGLLQAELCRTKIRLSSR